MIVLIVDDDSSVCSILTRTIKKWGYTYEICGTGKEALALCKQKSFDVMLLDIFLPGGSAHKIIPEIQIVCPEMKIITMTGMNTEKLEKEIRELGILYYLAKPIQQEELRQILEHQSNKLKQDDDQLFYKNNKRREQ